MATFTRDKDLIAGLDNREKTRLIAILMSYKDIGDAKIDWEAAAERFGAGSKESMRVHSGKTLNKVKVANGAAKEHTANTATEDNVTTETPEKKKTATPKKRKNNADDEEILQEQSSKKKSGAGKKKAAAQDETEILEQAE